MSAFSSLLLPSFFLFPGQPLQLLPNPPTRFSRLRCHRRDSTSVATMVKSKAIRVHELGGPEVLRWEEVEVGEPGEGEIRIRTTAVGVNFIDIYFRKGVYAAPTMPFTPGITLALAREGRTHLLHLMMMMMMISSQFRSRRNGSRWRRHRCWAWPHWQEGGRCCCICRQPHGLLCSGADPSSGCRCSCSTFR